MPRAPQPHFDENEARSVARDQVYLAATTAVIALDDREAARTQKLRGESFGGVAAVHCGGA